MRLVETHTHLVEIHGRIDGFEIREEVRYNGRTDVIESIA